MFLFFGILLEYPNLFVIRFISNLILKQQQLYPRITTFLLSVLHFSLANLVLDLESPQAESVNVKKKSTVRDC